METTLLHANEADPGNGIVGLLICVNNEMVLAAWIAGREQNLSLCPLHPLARRRKPLRLFMSVLVKVCAVLLSMALLVTEV